MQLNCLTREGGQIEEFVCTQHLKVFNNIEQSYFYILITVHVLQLI